MKKLPEVNTLEVLLKRVPEVYRSRVAQQCKAWETQMVSQPALEEYPTVQTAGTQIIRKMFVDKLTRVADQIDHCLMPLRTSARCNPQTYCLIHESLWAQVVAGEECLLLGNKEYVTYKIAFAIFAEGFRGAR